MLITLDTNLHRVIKSGLLMAAGILMAYFFLDYSRFFLDEDDPVAVATYYHEALRNREYFLGYGVFLSGQFDVARVLGDYETQKYYMVSNISSEVINQRDSHSLVNTHMAYHDGSILESRIELCLVREGWRIKSVSYQ